MSYAYEYAVPAAEAIPAERAAFIRRTYGHLAGAILAFIGIEALLLQIPGIKVVVGGMLASWWLLLLVFMAVSWVADYWARSDTSRELQYLGLGIYVLLEAAIFLPLLYIAEHHFPKAIGTAGIFTGAMFAGLTAVVFLTRADFSFLRTTLTIGGFLALGLIFAGMFLGFTLGLWFSFAMVTLASGFILYDTSNVLHHYRTNQHVAASLALFASVALLFWYVLQIVMSSRK